jgi:hypothetical protein
VFGFEHRGGQRLTDDFLASISRSTAFEGAPVLGAVKFLRTLLENNWRVVIFSTRLADDGSIEAAMRR